MKERQGTQRTEHVTTEQQMVSVVPPYPKIRNPNFNTCLSREHKSRNIPRQLSLTQQDIPTRPISKEIRSMWESKIFHLRWEDFPILLLISASKTMSRCQPELSLCCKFRSGIPRIPGFLFRFGVPSGILPGITGIVCTYGVCTEFLDVQAYTRTAL